jgi:hypothetical protein
VDETWYAVVIASTVILFCAGCATSPDAESRRQAMAADIDAIIGEPLVRTELGNARRCLADREYRSFRALDERHMLFEGPGGKLWINALRADCPDLRYGTIVRVKSYAFTRICDRDTFQAEDWFDWPWYRRLPWHWGTSWTTGMQCTLGEFQPVTRDQVEKIEEILKSR